MSNPISDTIIYNATVSNNTGQTKILEFNDYRRQNILDHAEDYYVRAFEAKIPVMSVPFFRMYAEPLTGVDRSMKVTIGDKTVSLIPIQLNPVNGDVVYIFYIQQFLDSLNAALIDAHVQNGFPAAVLPPKMVYDYGNDLLLFAVSPSYYNFGINPVPIYFNSRLMYKLTGFMNIFEGNLNREYRIMYENYAASYVRTDEFGIAGPSIFMPSQSKFYKDLLEFQSIIITTRALKVNEQYISTGSSENQSLPILAEIPLLFDEINSSKNLIFSQNYPKWIVLNFSGPLKTLDMYAYFVGDDFETYPLYILPGQKFNIRLEFNKKNLVKHYST
jgi:hypothetical protein